MVFICFLDCFIRQQLALTHPSYHLNFGMNPDHARNSLSNCGVKQPRYGDRKIRHLHTRKKGMSKYREINAKAFELQTISYPQIQNNVRKQGLSLIQTFYNPRGRIKTRFVSDVSFVNFVFLKLTSESNSILGLKFMFTLGLISRC